MASPIRESSAARRQHLRGPHIAGKHVSVPELRRSKSQRHGDGGHRSALSGGWRRPPDAGLTTRSSTWWPTGFGVRLPQNPHCLSVHECRSAYGGHDGSFETTLTGLAVRLEDDKAGNLEEGLRGLSQSSARHSSDGSGANGSRLEHWRFADRIGALKEWRMLVCIQTPFFRPKT